MQCRRRFVRVACFCPLHLNVLPNGPAVPGSSFDISIGGVGVMSAVSLERGRTVRIQFHLKDGSGGAADEEVLGRIAYCNADESGNRLGVEFLEQIQTSTHPLLMHKIENL